MGKEILSIKEEKELSNLAKDIISYDNSLHYDLIVSEVDTLEFRLDQLGLNIYHLLSCFGSYSRINEILKNSFNIKEILIIHYSFNIPLESFNKFRKDLKFLLYPRYY